ncbi:site-specific integrase [Paracoccus sp. SCSIO 75233]|uniref:site-specific integrase n=1 Tax=Paracoccus sp. SCSIO 75233 TaxID=3017782 RepID=UPI0022F06F5F|nr:site-specific integrase [Paracoccus sp. SCSIO 75233]WBU51873.1 site-specific integrase [Paracoccus sp. SCSIO 75233]
MASGATLAYSIQALAPFWGGLTCDAVKGTTCRAYERERAKPRTITTVSKNGKETTREVSAGPPTVRRELGVLQAALNYAHAEGLLIHPIKVTLPKSGEVRDRWLTRDEVAQLLRHAEPHIRRFIILAIYTGRRAATILDLIWTRVDLDANLIRFRADGQAETNKRRGRVRIPRQLKAHLRRWSATPGTHVVMYRGETVASVRKGVARAAERAGIEGVNRHVLKHTAITWGVKDGMELEDAAEYFDTSEEIIRKHYWHHSPHHQERAVKIIERR